VLRELLKTVILMNSKNCNAMKKIFTKMMLWAVAATALVSCENNFNDTTVNGDTNLVKVTLTADKPTVVSENRTELEGTTPYWSVGDMIGVYTAQEKDADNYYLTNDATERATITTFTGTTALSNTLYVYYPYTTNGIAALGAKVDIPTQQAPTATSFDGKADIMIAKPVTLDAEGNQLSDLEFARLGAIVKVVLKDNTSTLAGQHVKTLAMTAASNLTGRVYLDVVNQKLNEEEGLYYGESNTVTAIYTEATQYEMDNANATYIIVYPQTLASGSKLTFNAQTEGYTITKEITLSQDIDLARGKVTTLNVSLDTNNVEEIETIEWVDNAYNLVPNITGLAVGDKVVIAAAGYNVAMGKQNGDYRDAVAITKNENSTIEIDSTVEVLTLVEGSVEGTFAFQTSDNKYLYAASSSSNNLKSQTTIDANASFAITIGENGVATVTAQGSNTRNIVKYNNSNPRFSCYSSGMQDICIYKLVGEYVVKDPAITLSVANAVIAHDATSGEVAVTTTNSDGWAITATTDDTWVSDLAYADGKITFSATVNESETEERTATVNVTATKADYENVTTTFTITQNKKQAAGEVVSGEGTISFASTAQRLSQDNNQQTWSNDGITFVNNKASASSNVANYSNPVRLYSGSSITVTAPSNITKIVFDANSSSYANALNSSIGTPSGATVTVSSDKVTIEYSTAVESVVIAKLSAKVYLDALTVTYGGSSEGGETPETPAPVLAVTSATTINVAAAGDVPTITYTITNPVVGQSVTASANQTWVHGFEVSSTDVTFYVDENTGAAREATVTLSYEGAESQTVTISQAAGNTGGGDEPEQGGTHFVKVTSTPSDWSGTYLIVYETGKVAFDGSLATLDAVGNTKTVTISNNQIEATDAMKAIAFTIAKSGDANYSIKSASGKYIGRSTDSNELDESATALNNTIAFASADDITIKGTGGAYLRYNSASNQVRFRYYKSSSYSGQQAIQLYKLN